MWTNKSNGTPQYILPPLLGGYCTHAGELGCCDAKGVMAATVGVAGAAAMEGKGASSSGEDGCVERKR